MSVTTGGVGCLYVLAQAGILALTVLFAPSGAQAAGCEEQARSVGQYIPTRELGDWDQIDDRTVLIWVPGSARAHLVHLSRALPRLDEADELSVVGGGRDHIILPCGRDAIEIDDDPRTLAIITAIEPLSGERAEALLRQVWSAIST